MIAEYAQAAGSKSSTSAWECYAPVVVSRNRRKPAARPTLTVHQVVAYNFRRAREDKGWTQSQTSAELEPYLGYKLNQAGVSALEKTFDSDRRRNIDASELVAFSRCFGQPLGWFFLPPPGLGTDLIEPVVGEADGASNMIAADMATLAVGTPEGWDSFLERISGLLETDGNAIWEAIRLALDGGNGVDWRKQLELRRRALQQVTLSRFAGPEDDVITGMAALLVELVKLTPQGALQLRDAEPEEALARLAEGDKLVQPMLRNAKELGEQRLPSHGEFGDLEEIDVSQAIGRQNKTS